MLPCNKHFGCAPANNKIYSTDGELTFVICKNCKIIWRSPDSTNIIKDYGQNYFKSKDYASKRTHKVKKSGWLLDIASSYNPNISNMLEIGCSLGYTLEAAKKRDIYAFGTDISDYAINYCKTLGFNAEKKTFEELIVEQKTFDLIFMQHVLEHFQNPFDTLKMCHQLLNQNGLILVLVPNSEYYKARRKRNKHRFYSVNGVGAEHFVYFNYNNLAETLKSTGFEVLQKNYPSFLKGKNQPEFLLNRLARRTLNLFNFDQELLLIAKK